MKILNVPSYSAMKICVDYMFLCIMCNRYFFNNAVSEYRIFLIYLFLFILIKLFVTDFKFHNIILILKKNGNMFI